MERRFHLLSGDNILRLSDSSTNINTKRHKYIDKCLQKIGCKA